MMQFSANLGFLWTELSLPEAILAAKRAGFDAVECHWPYATCAQEVKATLAETGLPMLGLNTVRGDLDAGENGLAALPGREVDARAAIDQALDYGAEIGARNVHVMAGIASGNEAHRTFVENLRYACEGAALRGCEIVVEPLNAFDAPGYFLSGQAQAVEVIAEVGSENIGLMLDCYHVARTEGDVLAEIKAHWRHIRHIQFAAVPDRGAPDHGDLDYAWLFGEIAALGYAAPLGAEYKPGGPTEPTLGWMAVRA